MADQNLLDILQAHGEQFLDSFALPNIKQGYNKRKRDQDTIISSKAQKLDAPSSDSEEEWGGIDENIARDPLNTSGSESDATENEFEHDDDEFMAASSYDNSKVVVFQDIARSSTQSDPITKSQMKAFMSSKVSKLRQAVPGSEKKEKTEEEKDDERTNAQNDAILHRLVHTKLLSGSLDPDLDMTPAHRRKALAGRVLELSGTAKLGKGEKSVREKERNKASKRVREGLKEKQKERARQELEQAKDLGNYHPTLKKLFDDSDGPSSKKRERGLRMGVGKFRGGLLQLGREDLHRVEGAGRGGGSRGRGSSGGRGRGRGRGR
ncbi:hypothetical protein C0991_006044 [Blastosporella zonata]|nr:hypothetical protein C0991_006044 [Blastosporella zonata]